MAESPTSSGAASSKRQQLLVGGVQIVGLLGSLVGIIHKVSALKIIGPVIFLTGVAPAIRVIAGGSA
jgi:hypothetical protein